MDMQHLVRWMMIVASFLMYSHVAEATDVAPSLKMGEKNSARNGFVYTVASAANVDCLSETGDLGAHDLGYSVKGGNPETRAMIDNVVNTLIAHNKNSLQKSLEGVEFVISEEKLQNAKTTGLAGVSNAKQKIIQLDSTKLKSPQFSAAVIAHEICHQIGSAKSSGQKSYYEAYFDAVPTYRCPISTYSLRSFDSQGRVSGANDRVEEFAEVCSANLVAPLHLAAQTTSSCRKASLFMREVLFKAPAPSCAPKQKNLTVVSK
jgi:hypothetical protein